MTGTGAQAVLVTRPEPGASVTAARLARMGRHAIVAPMLRIVPVAADLPDAERVQAVLVTSANALPGLPGAFYARPLLAVGAATAAAAAALGFTNIASADADSAALTALVLRRCKQAAGVLLLATGAGQGEAFAAGLRGRGFTVARASVYAARPADTLPELARRAWEDGCLATALFFSAETARAFVRLARAAGPHHAAGIEGLAIAAPAALALAPLPWRRIRVADRPTQDALLALLT